MRYTSSPTDVALTSCHSSCGESSAYHTSQRGKRAISFSSIAGGGFQNVNSGFQPPSSMRPSCGCSYKNHSTKPAPSSTSSFHLSSFKSSVMGWSRYQSKKRYSPMPASRCGLQISTVHANTPCCLFFLSLFVLVLFFL